MKCILIDPAIRPVNITDDKEIRRAMEEYIAYPPVGLAYIAAFLRENGVDVKIIDAKSLNMSHDEVGRAVAKESPDLVGVTVFTSNLRSSLATCAEIKKVCPSTKIVVGGPHIDPLHEEVAQKYDFIDFCVRGEGEVTMLALAKAISNGESVKEVSGITFMDGDNAVVNPDRPMIKDLDTLPFPARDLLPNHIYSSGLDQGTSGIFAAVSAQRGCPFHCKFCSVPSFYPTQRRRSVQNICDELEEIYGTYGITNVRFTDEILPLNPKWMDNLCREMVERGLDKKIAWSCDNRVDLVRPGLLEKMNEAGCRVIFYGIEFGNQRILDLSKKQTTIAQIYDAIHATKAAGIAPTGNFMIGYPGETQETIEDTIALAVDLDLPFASFSVVMPFPGTTLYEYCKENNLLRTENWEEYGYFHPKEGLIKLDTLSSQELAQLYKKAYFEYSFREISKELKRELVLM